MSQTIRLKRSDTPGLIPTTGELLLGEVAINTYDGKLFFVKNNGTASIVETLTTENFTLDGLNDVTISSPAYRHTLIHNGTFWENGLLNLYQLGDTNLGEYGDGSTLIYNGTDSKWTTTPIGTTIHDASGVASNYYLTLSQYQTGLTRDISTAIDLTFNPNTGILSASGFSGSGAGLTSISAENITGTLPSTVLGNSAYYIGTTSIALNRPSGAQTLTGVSINGTATNATNLIGGNNTSLLGSIGYQSNIDTTTLLAPNTTTTKKFLTQTGTGTTGSAPSWSIITMNDLGTGTADDTTFLRGDGTWQLVTGGGGGISGIAITNDNTANNSYYVTFSTTTTGSITGLEVSSAKLTFNPSTGILSATEFSGSGALLTGLLASQLSGTIPSTVLGNSTHYIGTTAISLNRTSGAQTLTGVSIDGSASSASTATVSTNLSGGNNTTLLGSIGYQSNTNTTTLLSPNTTTTKKFLTQTGNGTNGAAPGWNTIAMSDLGTGTANSTTYLRGDGTWQTVSSGSGGVLNISISTNTQRNLTAAEAENEIIVITNSTYYTSTVINFPNTCVRRSWIIVHKAFDLPNMLGIGSEVILKFNNSGSFALDVEHESQVYSDDVTMISGNTKRQAFVNFDGVSIPSSIRNSYNIASVTRVSAGVYTILWATNTFKNANYVVSGAQSASAGAGWAIRSSTASGAPLLMTNNQLQIETASTSDRNTVCVLAIG